MNYHVGETVLSLQKTTLIPGGSESLVYTTLSGGIGILVPFTSHEVKSPNRAMAFAFPRWFLGAKSALRGQLFYPHLQLGVFWKLYEKSLGI